MSTMSTILIAEDSATCREPIATFLRHKGYRVVCAATGTEALALLEEHHPDLVLLDLAMPDMDGITFLQTIRKEPQWAHLPVIVLTALSAAETLWQVRDLGACEVLQKASFSSQVLLRHIQSHLCAPAA